MDDEPPVALQEMRVAWGWGEGRSREGLGAGELRAIEWLRSDPKGFRRDKAEMESAWESSRNRPCPKCAVSAEAKVDEDFGHLREWLRSHGGE